MFEFPNIFTLLTNQTLITSIRTLFVNMIRDMYYTYISQSRLSRSLIIIYYDLHLYVVLYIDDDECRYIVYIEFYIREKFLNWPSTRGL